MSSPAEWVDISAFVDESARGLGVGEMIHSPNFNLMEIMSACEIMDPKTDSGMVDEEVPSLDDLFETKTVPAASDLTPPQTLAVMDRLISCLMTWLAGNSPPQTILSCLYVHLPYPYNSKQEENSGKPCWSRHPVLSPFIASYLKIVSSIRECVNRFDSREEEEISIQNFGFSFLESVPSHVVLRMIQQCVACLAPPSSASSAAASAPSYHDSEDQEELISFVATLEPSSKQEFFLRSKLIQDLLSLHMAADSFVREAAQTVQIATKCVSNASSLKSSALSSSDDSVLDLIFDKNVPRRLPHPFPCRPIQLLSSAEAYTALETYCQHMYSLFSIFASSTPSARSYSSLVESITRFSALKPTTAIRSRLLGLLDLHGTSVAGTGSPMRMLTLSHICSLLPSSAAPIVSIMTQLYNPDGSCQLSSYDLMIRTLSLPLSNFLSAFGSNRSLFRRKLNNLYKELAEVSASVEAFAASLECKQYFDAAAIQQKQKQQQQQSNGKSGQKKGGEKEKSEDGVNEIVMTIGRLVHVCMVEMTTRTMILSLELGLEIDLYHISEAPAVYWYLDYLTSSRVNTLRTLQDYQNRIHQQYHQSQAAVAKPSAVSKGGKKSEPKQEDIALLPLTPQRRFEIALLDIRQYALRGAQRLMHGLVQYGFMSNGQNFGFVTPSARFEKRFAPFYSITSPQVVDYDTYKTHSNVSKFKPEEIFKHVEELFVHAKVVCEQELIRLQSGMDGKQVPSAVVVDQISKLEALKKVCGGNIVCVRVAKAKVLQEQQQQSLPMPSSSAPSAPRVQLDYSIHPIIPLIKIK